MFRRKLPALIAAAAMALTLTACGDEKADPIPSPTPSESPRADVSPAPDAPDLNADQQKAYDDALAVYTKYRDFVIEFSQDPTVTRERTVELLKIATREDINDLSNEIEKIARAGARVEGERDVAWTVPDKVSNTQVVLRQCETPGTWTLVGSDGKQGTPENNGIRTVTVRRINDQWKVDSVKSDGKC